MPGITKRRKRLQGTLGQTLQGVSPQRPKSPQRKSPQAGLAPQRKSPRAGLAPQRKQTPQGSRGAPQRKKGSAANPNAPRSAPASPGIQRPAKPKRVRRGSRIVLQTGPFINAARKDRTLGVGSNIGAARTRPLKKRRRR